MGRALSTPVGTGDDLFVAFAHNDAMFAMDDNTHLNMQGAVEVTKLAVAGIRALGLPLAARALP